MGLGSKLLKQAEYISYINGYKKIAVISGVGVRNYYRKKGYYLGENDYMYKQLKLVNFITTYKILFILFILIIFIYLKIIF